ncbi:MAG: efflux RND transporter permease subunit, partial [Vicinamibacterales bacterium]
GWTLRQTIRFKALTMLVSAGLLAGTVYLFIIVPKGFIPSVDTGQLSGDIQTIQGIGFEANLEHIQQVMAIVEKDPNVAGFTANAGGNGGRLNLDLQPRNERALSADQIINELRPKLAQVPGTSVYLQNPPAINIGGYHSHAQYQYTLQDVDTDELYSVAPKFEAALQKVPGLEDVNSDLQIKNPQITVDLDRQAIAALGLTVDQVESALSAAYGTQQVSQIYAPDDEYQVIMQVAPQYQQDPAALSMLYVQANNAGNTGTAAAGTAPAAPTGVTTSSSGRLVPLSAVVTTHQTVGPLSINHTGQLPSVTMSFNLAPGVALGDALARVEALGRQMLPATVTGTPQGTAQAFQDSMRGLGWILALAIFVIYVILGVLYESFIHPLTILSGLPSAGFGALLTLLLFHQDLDIYAFIGIIMLVGIVKKNGIMMIDFAVVAQRERGLSGADAIYEACMVRFRPIMMTTMAALMGTLPIALGWGAGAEARRPLGLCVVGGLVVSQTLTLYVTPVFYVYMELLQEWLGRRKPITEPVLAGGVAHEQVAK